MGVDTSFLHPGAIRTKIYKIGDPSWGPGVWWSDEPFPGWASLVPPDFPTLQPGSSPMGAVKDVIKNPKNLIFLGAVVGLLFFRKPVMKALKSVGKSVKKVGKKVKIK